MNTLPKLNPSAAAKSTCLKLKRVRQVALSLAAAAVIGGGAGMAWGI